MQRRTACFPETPPESQRADDQSGSACYMRRWVTEKLTPHFGGKHLHLHRQRSPLQDTGCRGVTEIPRRLSTGCCSGEMSTAGFFWGGSPQTSVETKQHQGWNSWVWLAASQLPGDCAPVALMAACVMEMGLELPKLVPHLPSCVAPLWPASFSVQKPLLR